MKEPPAKTVHLKCLACGHEQDVTSVCGAYDATEDNLQYWFGSDYNFCQNCDGELNSVIPKEFQ
jgi:hypothetical protein